MTTRILTLVLSMVAAMVVAFGFDSKALAADELDNESSVVNVQALRAKDLPASVVVRVNEKTGEASVLESSTPLATDAATREAVHKAGDFKAIAANGVKEVDQMTSTSSWYAWYNPLVYFAPVYYYFAYTYNYRPYYTYNSYGYNYYYYGWRW